MKNAKQFYDKIFNTLERHKKGDIDEIEFVLELIKIFKKYEFNKRD